MTSVEYGRHVRRIQEWEDVEADVLDATPRAPVDMTHGSVFVVEDDDPREGLLASVARLLGRRVV